MKAFAPIWKPGDLHHDLPIVFAGIHKEQIIEGRLCTEDELAELTHALSDHLSHPDTFVVYSLLFQAWGIKPVHKENPRDRPNLPLERTGAKTARHKRCGRLAPAAQRQSR